MVAKEVLKYRHGEYGTHWKFLDFKKGTGKAVANEALEHIREEGDFAGEEQKFKLKAKDILAIKGLAQLEKFPAAVALGNLIEGWHLSDIHIDEMRGEHQAIPAQHLSPAGDNLSSVIDYLHRHHRDVLATITDRLKQRVPGVSEVITQKIETGQILLKIKETSFEEPFLVRHVSDGTIKMLAYLVLLHDPNPHPLLCVEEPENQLSHKVLEELAEEFRGYAHHGRQVFVSTYSPDFLNAVEIDEVLWLVKENDGYGKIVRADSNEQVKAYMEDGEKMGILWQEGHF